MPTHDYEGEARAIFRVTTTEVGHLVALDPVRATEELWVLATRAVAEALRLRDAQHEAEVIRLNAERDEALEVLAPNMPENGLVDACRQVKQVAISEADNAYRLERVAHERGEALREFIKAQDALLNGGGDVDPRVEGAYDRACAALQPSPADRVEK